MTAHVDIAVHEDSEPVSFRLVRRDDGVVERSGSDGGVYVTELLLAEDIGADRDACDELIDAVQQVAGGAAELVELGWDVTEVEVRAATCRVRPSAPAGAYGWTDVPTRELYDALLQLRAMLVASGG